MLGAWLQAFSRYRKRRGRDDNQRSKYDRPYSILGISIFVTFGANFERRKSARRERCDCTILEVSSNERRAAGFRFEPAVCRSLFGRMGFGVDDGGACSQRVHGEIKKDLAAANEAQAFLSDRAAFSGVSAAQDFESDGRLCEAGEQSQLSKMKSVTQPPCNRVGELIQPRSNRSWGAG